MSLFTTLIPSLNRAQSRSAGAESPSEKPRYTVTETAEAYNLLVHLPGVARDGLEITSESGTLRIVGKRAWKRPESWEAVHRESSDAPFEVVFTHDRTIDAEAIKADLKDGLLRVSLPKAESAKPRKIAVA